MGFSVPRRLRFERWSLTPPFHPYHCSGGLWPPPISGAHRAPLQWRYLLCGTFRRDASRRHLPRVSPQRGTRTVKRGIFRVPRSEFRVEKLRGIAPYGVRTFLPRPAVTRTEAILRLSKTDAIILEREG